jgi:hypothetical protein
MTRYVLPCFMIFEMTNSMPSKTKNFWFLISGIQLSINTILFSTGLWIA